MHDPPRILVVDDNETNRDILITRLAVHGYELLQAGDGEEAIEAVRRHAPDLVLLDVMMPKIDGIGVCRRLKSDREFPFTPVILVTAKADTRDIVAGLEAGADEYLTKPVDQSALVARVRSMLRFKALHDQVQAQASDLASLNHTLEKRVIDQVAEIERGRHLKRFLPPQVAELIANGNLEALKSHRREVVAVMCDLRGFTSFAETGEPEDVIALLQDYHRIVVPLVFTHEGTLERFIGDGILVIFNDPLPCNDPAGRAVRMAVEMREAVAHLSQAWKHRGQDIGFGIGIAQGFATIGQIGFEGRVEYSTIGTVINLAARLCGEAADGQVLVSRRIANAVDQTAVAKPVGELKLKGLSRAVTAFNIEGLREG